MKRIATLLTAFTLALGVSVCSAAQPDVTGGPGLICRDGVCELTPAVAGSGEQTRMAANANPYNNAVPDVEAKWEKDMQPGPRDVFVANTSEYQVGIVYFVNAPIRNFKVLALELKEMSPAGKPIFNIKELYTKDVLRPERPLLVKTALFGSIPNNGFSYTDGYGKTRYYAVSESGMDGSVVFSEF